MKRVATTFLQIIILLIGAGVLVFLLWEPHLEGRNVNATVFEVYFKDPFLAYIYLAFVPFFVGLYQTLKLIGLAGRNDLFSREAARAWRIVKYCALTTALFFVGAEAYIFVFVRGTDDVAGGVMMGAFIILLCAVTGATAALLERKCRRSEV